MVIQDLYILKNFGYDGITTGSTESSVEFASEANLSGIWQWEIFDFWFNFLKGIGQLQPVWLSV